METAHTEDPSFTTVRAPLDPKVTRAGMSDRNGWKKHQTSPIESPTIPTETPVRITARQRHTVALLRADATDVQVAKALGVSVRTVRKDVAELMSQFGVRSRFALGVAIARHLVEQ